MRKPRVQVSTWWTLSEQLNSLLLKAQYQPVIQNIFFWLPRAVPKEEFRNMTQLGFSTTQRKVQTTYNLVTFLLSEDIDTALKSKNLTLRCITV